MGGIIKASTIQHESSSVANMTLSDFGGVTFGRTIESSSTYSSDIFSVITHNHTTTLTTAANNVMWGTSVLNTSGIYIFSLGPVSDYTVGGNNYFETYTGLFSWYKDGTNGTDESAIYSTSSGHTSNGNGITFRIARSMSGVCYFQMYHTTTSCTGNYTYVFKFKRIL